MQSKLFAWIFLRHTALAPQLASLPQARTAKIEPFIDSPTLPEKVKRRRLYISPPAAVPISNMASAMAAMPKSSTKATVVRGT